MNKIAYKFQLILLVWFLATYGLAAQNFQRIYGNSLDNSFNKVIRQNDGYFVLGRDEGIDGATARATVTRLDLQGQMQWTNSLDIGSSWSDAVLTPSGNLLLVGATAPFDNTAKSLMGLITPVGNFQWVKSYDFQASRESLTRIVRSPAPQNPAFPYYVLGIQIQLLPSQDDIFLLNIDENGNINWKKLFNSTSDDEYSKGMEVLPNGDLLLAGNISTGGLVVRVNNAGTSLPGFSVNNAQLYFTAITASPDGNFFTTGVTFTTNIPHLTKFNTDFQVQWDRTIPFLTALNQVWLDPGGSIYALGIAPVNGISRSVLLKFTETGGAPVLEWMRYLQQNETAYAGGYSALVSSSQIAFVDSRTGATGGFGQSDAFISVSNLELNSCLVRDTTVSISAFNLAVNANLAPGTTTQTTPAGTDLTSSILDWSQAQVCALPPPPTISCGDIKVNVEPGQDGRPVYYDWISATGDDVSLQCTPATGTTFPVGVSTVTCVATDASGSTATCVFNVTVAALQTDSIQPKLPLTPEGAFDHLRDRFGNPYRLADVQIPATAGAGLLCTSSGYFNLFFEPGCGMEGNSAVEVARRDVLCQLFSDLSNFITPANATVRVNIWVRDISQIQGVPPPMTSGILGLASSFYTMPTGATSFNGIVDGEVWKTINSGVDSYTGAVSPLTILGGAGAGYYHGIMAFNFVNASINWHTNLTAQTSASLYDLYAVALHEAVHALGFNSLIRPNGQSAFAPDFPYFSRYDLFLQSASGLPLITNTGACSMYAYQFNPSVNVSVLQPNTGACVFNQTTCATAIKFAGSVNQKVYTPNCYESGSSLSHLEDLCHLPTPQLNDRYYVMSNANGTGVNYMKRALKPEERLVLCDIGYKVNTSYGNAGQFTNFAYTGGVCPGLGVAGVNDGITSLATYAYQTSPFVPITIANALVNDYQAISFECLQVVLGGGTVNTTSGTSFIYTPPAGAGTKLLRYVPVSSSGKRGNITYIFIRVSPTGCTSSPCDLISNGNFELSSSCGTGQVPICWDVLSSSPDVLKRGCMNTGRNIPNTNLVTPAGTAETWDLLPSNQYYMGLWGSYLNATNQDVEAVQNTLTAPLMPGQTYTLSFYARVANNFSSPPNLDTYVQVSGSSSTLAYAPYYETSKPNLSILINNIKVTADNQWHFFSQNFTYTGSLPLNNFVFAHYPEQQPSNSARFLFVDNMKLVPQASLPAFTPPTTVCQNAAPVNLNGTVSPPGGTFAGPGVTCSGGMCAFNPASAGIGTHILTYVVTDANGCTSSATAAITVVAPPIVTFSPSPAPVCLNAPGINLNPLATPAGGNFSGPGVSCMGMNCTFNPATAGVGTHTITYTYTNGLCPVTVTAPIQVVPCAQICEVTNLCLDFDGVNDFVDVPSPLTTTTLQNNFTVAAWVRDNRTIGINDGNLYRIFGWTNTNRFELGDRDGKLVLFSNPPNSDIATGFTIRDGQWHHVAVSRTSSTVSVYVDGVVTSINNAPLGAFSNLGNTFHIGDWAGSGITPRFWRGRIDEFKVWDVALTAAQIAQEAWCGSDLANTHLRIHLPLDQGIDSGNNTSITTANNVSTAADGTLNGFTLNGSTSNWVARGRDLLPDCNVAKFDRIEGNSGRNIPGRAKVYDGDIFTAGVEYLSNGTFPSFCRRRSDGTLVWRTLIKVPGTISDFIRTDEGCYLLVGNTPAFTGNNKSFTARIDPNGVLDFLHTYELGSREAFGRIMRSDNPSDPLFPYVVCGIRNSGSVSDDDIVLFTLDNQGGIGWMRRIGGTTTDDEFRLDMMNTGGNYLLTGSYVAGGSQRALLFRTNNAGVQQSSIQYQAGTIFFDIEPTANGQGILIAGQLTSGEAILAKVNNAGTQVAWAKKFPKLAVLRKIVVKPNGDIYVVGQRKETGKYRNVIIKVQDLPGGVTFPWQKYLERPGESNWTPADLVWYSGDMMFYTDGRLKLPVWFGNEEISAEMYNFELNPDVCPVTKELPAVVDFTLVPSDMGALTNTVITPPVPQVSTPWLSYTLSRDSICRNDCVCSFSNMAFRKKGTTFYQPVACGNLPPVTVLCPGQYTSLHFSGLLNCTGSCGFSGMTWTLKNPANTLVGSGSSATAAFNIQITLSMVQVSGTYTLELTGICGNQTCNCVIKMVISDCPKPCLCSPDFTTAVYAGYNWVQSTGCNFKFTPKALTECDKVDWKVATNGQSTFTNMGSTTGNQTLNYHFGSSGQYVICFTVKRTSSLGDTCRVTRYWIFDVDCNAVLKDPNDSHPESFLGGTCNGSVIDNDGFTIGAEEGGLAETGLAWEWDESAGNPEIVLEPGKNDYNLVRLRGNGRYSDLLYQDSLNLNSGRAQLSLAFRPIPGLILPGTDLVVRVSSVKQDTVFCLDESTCHEILRLAIPNPDSLEWLVVGANDSLTFAGKYITIHVENPFVDDEIGLKSVVDIDNVCLRPVNFVSASGEPGLKGSFQLFPNPTTGQLTLTWQGTTLKNGRVQIIGPLGQVMRTLEIPGGAESLDAQLADLPGGLYFVAILSEGALVQVLKFVKQ